MSQRSSLDPYGGADHLVDKMIGTAYDNVLIVARNIKEVVHVSQQLGNVQAVSENLVPIRTVAKGMDAVTKVADNMDSINSLAAELPRLVAISVRLNELVALSNSLKFVSGRAGVLGTTTNIPLGTGIDSTKVISVAASIRGSDGYRYFPDGVNFMIKVSHTSLVVTLSANAPAVYANGLVSAQFTQSP